jgi:hypothetical protein
MKKNAKVTVAYISVLGVIISVAVLGISIYHGMTLLKFNRQGASISASILEKKVAESIRTHSGDGSITRDSDHIVRVSFFVETEAGSNLNFSDIVLAPNKWSRLEEGQRVDIVYVPGDDDPEAMLSSQLERMSRTIWWKIGLSAAAVLLTFFISRTLQRRWHVL